MEQISLNSYAKINLGLDVIRCREDGYHDVSMIMQTINIYDTLIIAKKKENKITLHTNLDFLPVDENNLAYKAANLLKEEFPAVIQGVDINLTKQIPVAAGMGGGSSNAAAVLKGMNELYDLHLSTEQLQERGLKLGADVPYCIIGGTVLSQGIGEKLTILPPMPPCYIVIVKPPISVSTRYVYEHLRLSGVTLHPDINGMVTSISHNDLYGVAQRMENLLETVTINRYAILDEIKRQLLQLNALNSLMSGSGPTIFGIFDKESLAKQAYETLLETTSYHEIFLTEPVNH